MSTLPPPPYKVPINSLEAARAKLGIQVSMQDLCRTIHEVEEAKDKERFETSESHSVQYSFSHFSASALSSFTFTPVGKCVPVRPKGSPA